MQVKVYDEVMTIRPEIIQQTREYFIDIANRCIQGAKNKEFHVNNLEEYILEQQQTIEDYRQGKSDHYLVFVQRCVYLQTNKSVPILEG